MKKIFLFFVSALSAVLLLNGVAYAHKASAAKDFHVKQGILVPGVLFNGGDFPAFTTGKIKALSVIIRLSGPGFLPHKYSAYKDCKIITEGYGSLSSERVYLRTVTLSCVVRGGKGHISAPIKGYIVGEHGKVGLRGKVITKSVKGEKLIPFIKIFPGRKVNVVFSGNK